MSIEWKEHTTPSGLVDRTAITKIHGALAVLSFAQERGTDLWYWHGCVEGLGVVAGGKSLPLAEAIAEAFDTVRSQLGGAA